MGDTTNSKVNQNKIKSFINDERFSLIMGVVICVICLYLAFTLISFFFTGAADQSVVENELVNATVSNWAGYRGAVLSNYIIADTFGISCFFSLYYFFMVGLNKIGFVQTNLVRTFLSSSFFLLWFSLFLGFLNIRTSFFALGGFCGICEAQWFKNQIGSFGTFLFIITVLFIYIVYAYKSSTSILKKNLNLILSHSIFKKLNFGFVSPDNETESSNKNNSQSQKEEGTNSDNIKSDVEQSQSDNDLETESVKDVEPEKTEQVETEQTNTDGFKITVSKDDDETVDSEETKSIEENDDTIDNQTIDSNDNSLYDPKLDLSNYESPSLDLLNDSDNTIEYDKEEQIHNQNIIKKTLSQFGIEIDNIVATVGPTITLYEFGIQEATRISKIKGLSENIAYALAAKTGIRIIAPIPGKKAIGIEVPNKNPQMVSMKSILKSKAFNETTAELPIALGKTITNGIFIKDLAKCPHLLVAGATGQGKSVGLNALITSLLYKKHPSQLKFVMIDPKQVEFSMYSKIEKHFLAKLPGDGKSIITNFDQAIQTLNSLAVEMDNRYTLLEDARVRNIKEYNNKFINRHLDPLKEIDNGNLSHHYLPYIVVIVDEYGDLFMQGGKEVEMPIIRIAQKARAVGIHMVLATQRPSTNIVTGTIKANFPARIAFHVSSRVESQIILDSGGAESLIGRGDFLYSDGGCDEVRVQCAFVDTPEVENVSSFIGNQQGYEEPYRLPEYEDESGNVVGGTTIVDKKSLDPMLKEAAELIISSENSSTSSLQRQLNVGFNRAGRIMDQLAAIGVVGPQVANHPRDIIVKDLDSLERVFVNLNK